MRTNKFHLALSTLAFFIAGALSPTAFADGISGTTTAANLTCTGQCLTADGTVTAPGYSFTNETNSGLYRLGAGDVRFTLLGADVLNLNANGIRVPNGTAMAPALAFSSQTGLGIYRQAASVLSFTGTAGNSPLLDFDAFNNVLYPDSAGGTPTNLGKTTAPFNNVFAQGQFNLQPNNTASGSGFQFIPEPAGTLPLIQAVNCTPVCTTSWNMGFAVGNTFSTSFGNGTISAADLNFTRGAASSANGITVNYGVPTGNSPSIVATGNDLNVGLTLTPKGTGTVNVGGATSLSPANANVTISPTGTGTVTINPATVGTMDNVNIGNTTRGTGKFTTLDANGAATFALNNFTVGISQISTSGGNVGFGTTSPTTPITVGGTVNGIIKTVGSGANTDYGYEFGPTAANSIYANTAEDRLVFRAAFAERMRITNIGVGIGMIAARNLDVSGSFGATGATTLGSTLTVTGAVSGAAYATATNCAVNSVSPAACGSAAAGAFVVPTTTTTYTVNTTAVSANSVILLTPRTDTGNLPGTPTCTVPAITAEPVRSAIVAGTSFSITIASTTGQTCWQYFIVN